MARLPILLSVPHAGRQVPDRIAANCTLTLEQIVLDGDEQAAEIYDLEDEVAVLVTTKVARAVLDMNRSELDKSKDGVVKTHTCWDVPVWRTALQAADVEKLFVEHHRPYHAALSNAALNKTAWLGIDAHTMSASAPPVAPDPGQLRPSACVSNAWGTCPTAWMEFLTNELSSLLGETRINDPFSGGHITQVHGTEMPWLQLELSRGGLLSPEEKRAAVLIALTRLCEKFADKG
jgi:N-formylglutamate deformylase